MNNRINRVVIGVGSNINPKENIWKAKEIIAEKLNLLNTSSFIRTEPIGYEEQNDFLNGAFLVETNMDQASLDIWLKQVERKLGRDRKGDKNGPREIDLDIAVWNGQIVDMDVYEREFLQRSIKELLPDLKLD